MADRIPHNHSVCSRYCSTFFSEGTRLALGSFDRESKGDLTCDWSIKARERERIMLWTILAIVLILWSLGLIGSLGGGLIHLLLALAAVMLLIHLLSDERTAT
jgi:uncharacterized protein DUF5670